MVKNIQSIKEFLILSILFLFPIVFSGNFIDSIGLPKLIILITIICLLAIVMAVEIYITGKLNIPKSKFDLPVLIIVLSYLASAIITTPNKSEAFFLPGTATLIVGLGLLYFLLNTIDRTKIKMTLIGSSVALSLLTIVGFLGVFSKIPHIPSFMSLSSFNPTGDYLTASIFLIAVIPLSIMFLIKESDVAKKLVFAFSFVFILIATGISIFFLLSPDKKNSPLLPPYQTSWAVAVDSVRENPLLGIGPGNYTTAFNRFRPITYNTTNLWQIRFATATDWYMTVITETGLLGLVGIALLVLTIIKTINKNVTIYRESKSLVIDVISFSVLSLLLVAVLIFPATPVTIFAIFVFLSLNAQPKQTEIGIPRLISIILIGLVAFLALQARPVILAEANFKDANDALAKNDGKKTYDLLRQSINLNPYEDRYHASYAQVNLAIARSIVGSVKDAKDLTDDQKNTVLQLIQQAIREGQATVSLNPTRSANWQVLANIYQTIIPYASQSDQFAVQSYNQATNLDPIDPNLRISLGGLYYSLGQYDNALSAFQFAVYMKPDLPNAYYNLAATYAAKNDFTNAIAAMNKVISLIPKDSADAKTAQDSLETLQNKQKTLEATNSANLTTPKKQQAPAITPQLTLPEQASPPAGPNLPSPSPISTVTPTATSTPTPKP